jgi:hypothetical protein
VFDAFINSVLPVFAMVGLGALCRYFRWFAVPEANALSKFVYFIAGPVLLFRLISTVDLNQFNWLMIASYLIAEIIVYVLAYLLFRRVFRRDVRESLLLGMTSVFANHVLYLLPIAIYQFGEARAAAIVTFIAGDLIVVYGATLLLLDATAGGPGGTSVVGVARRMATNPQLIALALGLIAKVLNIPIGGGFAVFAQFLSSAASPTSLFALGIVLMSQQGLGDLRVSLAAAGLKLLAMPAAAAFLLLVVFRQPMDSAGLTLLISSAPSGVMTFVLAMRYNVPSENVGRAVLISTLLSTVSVSLMLQAV